jgi:hypothetical protein
MVALGLVLLVLSGALGLGVVLSNTDPVSASAFGVTLSNVTIGGLFLVGALTGLVFMLGLVMMTAGASRRRARRVEAKRAVTEVRTEKEQLEYENAQLRERLTSDPYPSEPEFSDRDTTSTTGKHARGGLFHRG